MCFCFGSFQQKGLTTPRAFVDYDRLKDPEPRYFEAILRNSLTEDEIRQFCADFLALFRPKEHKQPVLCAIGSADSGKTSLFSPVFQIIPLSRIARVTKQMSFNKAMIDNLTEVIFLDEAYATLLDIDDWKIIIMSRGLHVARREVEKGSRFPLHCDHVHNLPGGNGF